MRKAVVLLVAVMMLASGPQPGGEHGQERQEQLGPGDWDHGQERQEQLGQPRRWRPERDHHRGS